MPKKVCQKCSKEMVQFVERRSLAMTKERSSDGTHFHHGVAFYKYGICSSHHLTRISRTKISWDPCLKCQLHELTFANTGSETHREVATLRIEVAKLRSELEKIRVQTQNKSQTLPLEITWKKSSSSSDVSSKADNGDNRE